MSEIRTTVNYEGVQQGREQIEGLVDALSDVARAQDRARGSTTGLENALGAEAQEAARAARATTALDREMRTVHNTAQGLAQRVDVVEGKLEAFGSALGTLGSTMQGISPELDAVGEGFGVLSSSIGIATSMPGPLGIALASLNGVMGLASMATRALEEDSNAMAEAQQRAADATENLIDALRRQRQASAITAGEASSAAIEDAVTEARDVRDVVQSELAQARADLTRAENARRGGGSFRQRASQEQEVRRQQAAVDSLVTSLANAERGYQDLVTAQSSAVQRELRGGGEDDFTRGGEEAEDREDARRRRRGGDAAAAEEEAWRRYDEAVRSGLARQAEMRRAQSQAILDASEQELIAHEKASAEHEEAINKATDGAREMILAAEAEFAAREATIEQLDRQKEKERELAEQRLAAAREITGRVGDTLQTIASAYIDAFGKAIEGQMTLEEAALSATKVILKGLGEEMVGIGIRETLEGFANIVSAPPVAATKIPMGIALIGLGVGLGAAGAAIPSAPAAPAERPRAEANRGGEGGAQTLVINNNHPIISTGTHAQLSRQMTRQLRDGSEIPTRLAA